MTGASVEVLEHPGEVRLRLRAPTPAGIVAAAGRALAELELGSAPGEGQGGWRDLVVEGRDDGSRLVHWMNELIYRAETDRWVAVEFAVLETGATWHIRARGIPVEQAPSQVKAATFHDLRFVTGPDGAEAEIVLDV